MDSFYQKYLDVGGLPIVASSEVPNAAFYQARAVIEEMLRERADILVTMAEQGIRVAIMAEGTFLTGLPEFRDLGEFSPGVSWDERTRGGGVGPTRRRPVVVVAEENLLCYENDVFPYEDIVVHEFSHGVLNMGVERQTGGREFRDRLESAYEDALRAGLWAGTYAGTNADEYWAEGVQSWFGLNDPPGAIHNDINTRTELEEYDPVLAGLIQEVFGVGNGVISVSCHETVDLNFPFSISGTVIGPNNRPLEGIGLWAWQGRRDNSGGGNTGADGTFHIRVPEGSFTLDIYHNGGCIGWYDGTGGITTTRAEAARIMVDGTNVEGINIRISRPLDELAHIRC